MIHDLDTQLCESISNGAFKFFSFQDISTNFMLL